MFWTPEKMWDGEDAYVVGGGPSLASFDWSLIAGKNTVGCNSMFFLGAHVLKAVVFADTGWWNSIGRYALAQFGGLSVACVGKFNDLRYHAVLPDWLLLMYRGAADGLGQGRELRANGHTGGLAINLALSLGARRLYLLGFDMHLGRTGTAREGKANCHDVRYENASADSYPRFLDQFGCIQRDLKKFPGSEIINVTNDSDLSIFPKQTLEEHFHLERKQD